MNARSRWTACHESRRVRSCCLSCLLSATHAAPTLAADGSAREILGFSPDGSSFAFAQSGVQARLPVCDVFIIIDARSNIYAAAPVHVMLENDGVPRRRQRPCAGRTRP